MTESAPGYLGVVYDEQVRPATGYPGELCRHLARRFALPAGARLLDVGCGRGEFARGFADLGLAVEGLDRERCESRWLRGLTVGCADLGTAPFPYPDGRFDVVFSKSVIEHFERPGRFLAECRRVLRPGGRLIVLTPDWQTQMPIFYDDITHCRPFTVEAMHDALRMHGFAEVGAELFYQLPVVWRWPALKAVSWLLRRVVPVTAKPRNKFVRWSIELMILGTGVRA